MRLTSLIAKGEVRQARTDLWADTFNVDFRGRCAGLRLASLADANCEQRKSQDCGVSSTAEQVAHGGQSFPDFGNTRRPTIYSGWDCVCALSVNGRRQAQGSKPNDKTARYDDIMD